ncbi:MAG: hypothetical protein ACTSU2_16445 [Promethearchaeota archaeon]
MNKQRKSKNNKGTEEITVKVESIKMALMRYVDELILEYQSGEKKIARILSSSSLELKDDLCVITVKQRGVFKNIKAITGAC